MYVVCVVNVNDMFSIVWHVLDGFRWILWRNIILEIMYVMMGMGEFDE